MWLGLCGAILLNIFFNREKNIFVKNIRGYSRMGKTSMLKIQCRGGCPFISPFSLVFNGIPRMTSEIDAAHTNCEKWKINKMTNQSDSPVFQPIWKALCIKRIKKTQTKVQNCGLRKSRNSAWCDWVFAVQYYWIFFLIGKKIFLSKISEDIRAWGKPLC